MARSVKMDIHLTDSDSPCEFRLFNKEKRL